MSIFSENHLINKKSDNDMSQNNELNNQNNKNRSANKFNNFVNDSINKSIDKSRNYLKDNEKYFGIKKLQNDVKSEKIEDLKNNLSSKPKEEKKKEVENISFSYYLKIKNLICKKKGYKSDHQKIYDILNSYINRRIDVICYLQYLDKFDKFKSFYFNETQQIAFDHFKKPNISNKKELEKINLKLLDNYSIEKEKIETYYLNSYKNEELTKKDEFIFENLPIELKENILKKVRNEKVLE